MRFTILVVLLIPLLSGCPGEGDRLVFRFDGSAFKLGDKLCIGGASKKDVLSYYHLEEIRYVFNFNLLNSGDKPLNLTFPETCFKVNLEPGKVYGILYIMNDIKYRYKFKVNDNYSIEKLPRSGV